MYAVGASHPNRQSADDFFVSARQTDAKLATSAEVLQELLHVHSAIGKPQNLFAALSLVEEARVEIWPLEKEDVMLAAQLRETHPSLSARDLCHLASCQRRNIDEMMTFDVSLRNAAQSIL